jgi:hypothetical protein
MASASDVAAIVAVIVSIIGWTVVNDHNNKLETRKEDRELINDIKKRLRDIFELSVSYFCSEKSTKLSEKIKNDLDDLEIEIRRYVQFDCDAKIYLIYVNFFDSVTSGDFESSSEEILDESSLQIINIKISRNNLIQELENNFTQKYYNKII